MRLHTCGEVPLPEVVAKALSVLQVQGFRRAATDAHQSLRSEDPEHSGPGQQHPTPQCGLRLPHAHRQGKPPRSQRGAAGMS